MKNSRLKGTTKISFPSRTREHRKQDRRKKKACAVGCQVGNDGPCLRVDDM